LFAFEDFNEEIIQILIEGVIKSETLKDFSDEVYFNNGDLSGYLSIVLSFLGGDIREKILTPLSQNLKNITATQSLNITVSILNLIIYKKERALKDIPIKELEVFEIEALKMITKYGGWKIGDSHFTNYSDLMRAYGLFGSQEKMMDYLKI